MRKSTFTFTRPSRRVYTATKKAVQQCGQFKRINGGANKKNVHSLEDYIRNEVYKLCSDEEIKLMQ